MVDIKKTMKDAVAKHFWLMGQSVAEYIFDGGNYLRPSLVYAVCDMLGGDEKKCRPLALAIECIHEASLIHDDLSVMDNEETRRGKPSVPKAYGDDKAVVLGDMLISEAFHIVCSAKELTYEEQTTAAWILSWAVSGMCHGQLLELSGSDDYTAIHNGKTAALIVAACRLGMIAAGSADSRFINYGIGIGMAYQFLDDLKDHDSAYLHMSTREIRNKIDHYLSYCDISAPDDHCLSNIVKRLREETNRIYSGELYLR